MCGIVGYVGGKPATEILVNGLKRLEYRGYDSAGVAAFDQDQLKIRRSVGKVAGLVELLKDQPVAGTLGIAHTRWATHGQPNQTNAHPHSDASDRIALVHNGIIENHSAIRAFLEKQGITFRSQTDTEALAQLIGFFYNQDGDLLGSIRRALSDVKGTYGVAIVCADRPPDPHRRQTGQPPDYRHR